jgi:hypothetical protein
MIQGGWGGCSGSGIAPNSDEPMGPVSPPKGADEGRNGGDFVFRTISFAEWRSGHAGRATASRGQGLAFPAGPPNFEA